MIGGAVTAVLHNGPTLKLRDVCQHTETLRTDPSSSTARTRLRSTVIAALASIAGGLTIAVTTDVIIGVAVGAALFALVDRATHHRQPPPTEVLR